MLFLWTEYMCREKKKHLNIIAVENDKVYNELAEDYRINIV